jgi:hypothetical protein
VVVLVLLLPQEAVVQVVVEQVEMETHLTLTTEQQERQEL